MIKDCPARFINYSNNFEEERTYIIFGMVRSGTSMMAGLLWRIGIDMGNHDTGQYEDWDFNLRSLKKKGEGITEYKKNIIKNNVEKKIWGWKDPLFAKYAIELIDVIRNPYFIVVFRDPFAITERLAFSDDKDLFSSMNNTLKAQKNAIDLIESSEVPTMLVSYERALRNRENLIKDLCKFSGHEYENLDENYLSKLNNFMKPGRYKNKTEFI